MRGIFAARAFASDLNLVQTSRSCPEQYDAIYRGERVGFMRLRYGKFTVECPGPDGELVFMSATRNSDAGQFETVAERKMNLKWAKLAISEWVLDCKRREERRCEYE